MSDTAMGAAVEEWGVLAAVIASLGGVAVALWQAFNSRRAGVSGDEREARRDEQAEKQGDLASRDRQIASLMQDREHLVERVDRLNDRVEELEQREDDTRTMLMMHAAWDWQAVELARVGGVILPPPPPLMAPRVPHPKPSED